MVLPGWHDSVVLSCIFITLVGADSLLAPAPENLTLSWDQDQLSVHCHWSRPAGLDTNCTVIYTVAFYNEQKCPPQKNALAIFRIDAVWHKHRISKEDEICVGVTTNLKGSGNEIASKEVYQGLLPPLAIVENFSCSYYAFKKMNCTWIVVKNISDLQLFYRIGHSAALISCSSYLTSGHNKTGCHMHGEGLTSDADVFIVINGTGETHLINRFFIKIRESVKPPKPKVNITKEGENLRFQAVIPHFIAPNCLKYKFMYSKCNEENTQIQVNSSLTVEYDNACKYTVQAQVIYSNFCGGEHDILSDMSELECHGEDNDPNLLFKMVMIITPLIVCCCLIASLLVFRRVKHIILPKIPEPSLFFKDMFNSTSDGFSKSLGGGKLYEPVKDIVANHVYLEPKSNCSPSDPCI